MDRFIYILVIMAMAFTLTSQVPEGNKQNNVVDYFNIDSPPVPYKLNPSYKDTCVSSQIIISAATELRNLRFRTQTQEEIIKSLEDKVEHLKTLNAQTNAIMEIHRKEIEIYENITEKFKERIADNTPWYATKEFHFILGAVIGGSAIYLGANI